jgi:hypothetical protein
MNALNGVIHETSPANGGTYRYMSKRQNLAETDPEPMAEIGSALREITEYLAAELHSPGAHAPDWSDFQWRIAKAVAAMQGISSLLCTSLLWTGPAHWNRFLQEQRDHVAGRCQKIERLLETIDEYSRRDGIALIGLKGTALLKRALYRPGDRPMADIDLLVEGDDVSGTTRLLQNCGFDLTFTTWRHHLFEVARNGLAPTVARLGEHVDNPIKIELHTAIRERLPVSEIDITAFVRRGAIPPGLNSYSSAASLMMHLVLHAAGNMRAHALRLIQLYDIALLAESFSALDWENLACAYQDQSDIWWAFPPMSMVERYFPGSIPESVLGRLAKHCPWWLRRATGSQNLAEVSWTNLRVYAFPGIEWSRTPTEVLRLVRARLLPDAETRMELTRFSSHHPGASNIPWYGVSQGKRILRWVFSKPPRVQALLPVRAALAERVD